MVDAAARWATAVKREESPRWLSLLGTSGTGNTHIAKRLWRCCQRPSDWTAEKINTLANVRVGKWTILTSNLSMVQIAQADNRIASRMVRNNGIVADVNTKDYNLR